MRLQSHIWVSAFIRSELTDGEYATVLRKGSAEAGAIFIVHLHMDGTCTIHAPAPQAMFDEADLGGRRFETVLEAVEEDKARQWLDRQIAFDSDCWIVESERRSGELSIFQS